MMDSTPDGTDQRTMIVAVDIGGTTTRIGRFLTDEMPCFTLVARYPTPQGYDDALAQIIAAVGAGANTVGVSFGGQLVSGGDAIHTAPNLPDYEGRSLAGDLASALGVTVWMAHDPVCGVLAERRFGALRHQHRCAYLTLSTGTGCAVHLRTDTTALTISMQIGHQILDGNAHPCLCGQIGCLETFTGGRQLTLRHSASPETITDPAFWEMVSAKLAIGLVNLAQLTRVETVAVSGGMALNHPELLSQTQERIDAQITGARLTIVSALLGDDAPLIGAALLSAQPDGAIIH